jgi:hypothetical protein
MGKLVELHREMTYRDWLCVLGMEWTGCDNIGIYLKELRTLLPQKGPVIELMDAEEIEAYRQLPEELELYRGCGPDNVMGACWSLDLETAREFPTLNRYKQDEPLLVIAEAFKEEILAIKLDRQEAEVIVFNVGIITIEKLT